MNGKASGRRLLLVPVRNGWQGVTDHLVADATQSRFQSKFNFPIRPERGRAFREKSSGKIIMHLLMDDDVNRYISFLGALTSSFGSVTAKS